MDHKICKNINTKSIIETLTSLLVYKPLVIDSYLRPYIIAHKDFISIRFNTDIESLTANSHTSACNDMYGAQAIDNNPSIYDSPRIQMRLGNVSQVFRLLNFYLFNKYFI